MAENSGQRTEIRVQIARLDHSRKPFDHPAPSIERCLTLCAMSHALCPFGPQLVTPNLVKLRMRVRLAGTANSFNVESSTGGL